MGKSKQQKSSTLKSLKDHQLEWYGKLKEAGFKDIESPDGKLKSWSVDYARQRNIRLKESREAYYRLAGHFLHEFQFASERDRIIWEYHAEGLLVQEIAETLRKVNLPLSRTRIYHTIARLSQSMRAMYLSGVEKKNNE